MAVSVAGVVALAWCWLRPVHAHHPSDGSIVLALGACLLTAALLGRLVAQARCRAARAEDEARALASEQAALRRVATLIGAGFGPERVFGAVTREVGKLLGLDAAALLRFESDGSVTVAGTWSRTGPRPSQSLRWVPRAAALAMEGLETGPTSCLEEVSQKTGPFDEWMRQVGARSCIASPVAVHGRTWGVMVGASMAPEPLPPATELRFDDFTSLAATAIANAYSRHELAVSKARIVTSTNHARQRIERDLHDGVQQRLVSLALDVRRAETLAESNQVGLREQLSELRVGLVSAVDDLREVAHGIHPSILTQGGLKPALASLARRSPIPVELTVLGVDRVPEAVEVGVYYVASEALTNALKHAQATTITVKLELEEAMARLVVRDDGVGGADLRMGSGLIGLNDRLEALGGAIEVRSPTNQGTRLEALVPWVPDAPSSSHSCMTGPQLHPGHGDRALDLVADLRGRAERDQAGSVR